jgi:hypothetical protein
MAAGGALQALPCLQKRAVAEAREEEEEEEEEEAIVCHLEPLSSPGAAGTTVAGAVARVAGAVEEQGKGGGSRVAITCV